MVTPCHRRDIPSILNCYEEERVGGESGREGRGGSGRREWEEEEREEGVGGET